MFHYWKNHLYFQSKFAYFQLPGVISYSFVSGVEEPSFSVRFFHQRFESLLLRVVFFNGEVNVIVHLSSAEKVVEHVFYRPRNTLNFLVSYRDLLVFDHISVNFFHVFHSMFPFCFVCICGNFSGITSKCLH